MSNEAWEKFKDRLGNNRLEMHCEIQVRGGDFVEGEPPSRELTKTFNKIVHEFGLDFPNVEMLVSREMGGIDIKMLCVGTYTKRENVLEFFAEKTHDLMEKILALHPGYTFNLWGNGGFKNTEIKQWFECANEGTQVTYHITKSSQQSPLPRIFNHKVRMTLLVLAIGSWFLFELYCYNVFGDYRNPVEFIYELLYE